MRTYTIVAALSLGLIAALAFWQSGRLLAPLRTLRDTTNEIKATDLSQRIPVTGNDDLTALSVTFNDMLDRLEASFTTQREFLDDAGHELKTPITVLRGHLELLDEGSPEDVEETRVLLLDEVDRMARLVNDLILLAKSNRPDFLARDDHQPRAAHGNGAGQSERTRSACSGNRTGAGGGAVFVDEQRLTQALLALADNAVKHTRDGDVVAIGSSYDDDAVRLWVRDSGEGVPAADREVIFETIRPQSGPGRRRGVRARVVDRPGDRRGARRDRSRRGRHASRIAVRHHAADGQHASARSKGRTDGPHPDHRGRCL